MLVFLAVFSRPARAFALAGDPGMQANRFFVLYGMPLLLAGSAGRMLLLGGEGPPGLFVFLSNLLAFVIALPAGSWMIARMAPSFGSRAGREEVFKLVVLSMTPFLLAQVVAGLFPALSWLGYAGLAWALIVYWQGLGPMAGTPRPKATGFALVSFFILLGLSWILQLFFAGFIIFAT
jgi:hypothetical protein